MTTTLLRTVFATTLGAVAFAVAFVIGTPLNLALGPAMGGMLNAVVTAMVVAIGCKGVERFPYATIVWLAFSLLAIFTPTMGPPGPHKPLIGLATGLVMEAGFGLLGRSALTYALIGGLMSVVMTLCILATMLWLGLEGAAATQLLRRLWFVLPVYALLGGTGAFLGSRVFDSRLRDLDVIRRLRQETAASG